MLSVGAYEKAIRSATRLVQICGVEGDRDRTDNVHRFLVTRRQSHDVRVHATVQLVAVDDRTVRDAELDPPVRGHAGRGESGGLSRRSLFFVDGLTISTTNATFATST